MTDRLAAALTELAEAIRCEIRAELAGESGQPEQLLSIPLAAKRLGVGRTAVYSEIQAGRLRSIRVGRRRLVPSSAIAERVQVGS